MAVAFADLLVSAFAAASVNHVAELALRDAAPRQAAHIMAE
jgi:hypothetical protein